MEINQAGLSWSTILAKREHLRDAYDNFDFNIIATYDDHKITELLNNKGIIRNKLKIKAIIHNAKIFLKISETHGSFSNYFWNFTDGKSINHYYEHLSDIPSTSDLGNLICKDMKKQGFKFIGPTIIYAYMQGVGMVNDHQNNCFRKQETMQLNQTKTLD